MVDPQVSSIANRMSLRPPLAESLELLHRVCKLIRLEKSQPVPEALQAIQATFPQVRDFERDFPSLCFNIATGVGKTRLMGAFITYLYKTHGIRHFFILAPNLTIYNKLIADFSPGSPKYVQGLAEFATFRPVRCSYREAKGSVLRYSSTSNHMNSKVPGPKWQSWPP